MQLWNDYLMVDRDVFVVEVVSHGGQGGAGQVPAEAAGADAGVLVGEVGTGYGLWFE